MITYPAYTVLHVIGVLLLFSGFGLRLMQSKLEGSAQATAIWPLNRGCR